MLEVLFFEYRYLLQYAAFVALAIFAWRYGEAPEKIIGLVLCSAIAFEIAHHFVLPARDESLIRNEHVALDIAMFAALTPIAMRANRIYPLWILAAQLIAVTMHFQSSLVPDLHPLAYWILIRLPFWIQMVAFGLGLFALRQRVRNGITATPWRRSLNR